MGNTTFKAFRGQTLEQLADQLNKANIIVVHYVNFDDKTRVWQALVEVEVNE